MSGMLSDLTLKNRCGNQALQHLEITVVHGTEDIIVLIEKWRKKKDAISKLPILFNYHEFPGVAHQITEATLNTVNEYLKDSLNRILKEKK